MFDVIVTNEGNERVYATNLAKRDAKRTVKELRQKGLKACFRTALGNQVDEFADELVLDFEERSLYT